MHLNARPVFFLGMRRTFDHLDNRSGFWIDPPDRRSWAKRTIQPPVAYLPNFLLHALGDRCSNPMPLRGCSAEYIRGPRHAGLSSSAIFWLLSSYVVTGTTCRDSGSRIGFTRKGDLGAAVVARTATT